MFGPGTSAQSVCNKAKEDKKKETKEPAGATLCWARVTVSNDSGRRIGEQTGQLSNRARGRRGQDICAGSRENEKVSGPRSSPASGDGLKSHVSSLSLPIWATRAAGRAAGAAAVNDGIFRAASASTNHNFVCACARV